MLLKKMILKNILKIKMLHNTDRDVITIVDIYNIHEHVFQIKEPKRAVSISHVYVAINNAEVDETSYVLHKPVTINLLALVIALAKLRQEDICTILDHFASDHR
jgi:hypothetical protein